MKTLNKKSIVFVFALLLILFNQIQAQTETVAQIDKYVESISALMEKQKQRIFADVASDGKRANWKEFKTEKLREAADRGDNLNENAYVWLKNDKVVAATFTNQSPSRDWVRYVTYYYREAGTLAKIESTHNTFYGDITIKRTYYFDSKGKMLKQSAKYFDLKTQKTINPKKREVDQEIIYDEVDFYKTTDKLAFIKLLKKTPARKKRH
jgi:hypothetical protein